MIRTAIDGLGVWGQVLVESVQDQSQSIGVAALEAVNRSVGSGQTVHMA